MDKYLQKKKRIQDELKQNNLSLMRRADLQRGLTNIERLINKKRKYLK